jgi:hypothetical protein
LWCNKRRRLGETKTIVAVQKIFTPILKKPKTVRQTERTVLDFDKLCWLQKEEAVLDSDKRCRIQKVKEQKSKVGKRQKVVLKFGNKDRGKWQAILG